MSASKPSALKSILTSTWRLFYPKICPGCDGGLLENEGLICISCLFELSYANTHDRMCNPVEEKLAGKIHFDGATALCYYHKSSAIQSLIHALKYKRNTDVGLYLGEMLGRELSNSYRFKDVDIVIPVPLHPRKLQQRGYNQSNFIAEGICNGMPNARPSIGNLYRGKNTNTQTSKSIFERWENVSKIFSCRDPREYVDKHVLIVDDVITSGSTIEGVLAALENIKDIRMSVGVLASAE